MADGINEGSPLYEKLPCCDIDDDRVGPSTSLSTSDCVDLQGMDSLSFLMPLKKVGPVKSLATTLLLTSEKRIWVVIEFMSSSMFGACEDLP